MNPKDHLSLDLSPSVMKSPSKKSFRGIYTPKTKQNVVSLDTLLPDGHHFIQYSQLVELYEDFSGSQFVDLLTALDYEFPEIVSLDKNNKIMKRQDAEYLLQFRQILDLYQSMQGSRFSERITNLAELYPNIVPIGRNSLTQAHANNGRFLQYEKLLDLYQKKECFEFTRRLKAVSQEYPQIVPINFGHEQIQEAQENQNQFLQYSEIEDLYDELSGPQFEELLENLSNQFPEMIPLGVKSDSNNTEQGEGKADKKLQRKVSEENLVKQEEVPFKQYKHVLNMYLQFNGVKFVKRMNALHEKYPEVVPVNWNKEEAENQHFLQYQELLDMYTELSGSQFVELMEGLIKQYPEIVPVGQENFKEEVTEICRFIQYGELLELHSELSGEQFSEMLQGLAKQYPEIVSLTQKHHVNIIDPKNQASFMQFSELQQTYSECSGPQFRKLLRMLKQRYPEIAPLAEFEKSIKESPKTPYKEQKVQAKQTIAKKNAYHTPQLNMKKTQSSKVQIKTIGKPQLNKAASQINNPQEMNKYQRRK